MTLASEWGTGQVFWSMLWFFLFFIWIWILITVFADLFRSHDLSGWAKAAWVIFVIFLPYLGVFVYLIARGHKMSEHAIADQAAAKAAFDEQVRAVSGTSSSVPDQLAKLADLKASGAIDDAEFQRLKAQLISS